VGKYRPHRDPIFGPSRTNRSIPAHTMLHILYKNQSACNIIYRCVGATNFIVEKQQLLYIVRACLSVTVVIRLYLGRGWGGIGKFVYQTLTMNSNKLKLSNCIYQFSAKLNLLKYTQYKMSTDGETYINCITVTAVTADTVTVLLTPYVLTV
jgi:hypothetical protein